MKIPTARLLPLEGAHNTRDLGGYPTKTGGKTCPGVFFRGDSTADLTEKDIALLRRHDVRLVIDLRSELETRHAPSRLQIPNIRYINLPMLDHINSGPMAGAFPASMGEMYEGLLEYSRDDYRQIFTLFAETSGAGLFHCTAGKDRTGVVAMLLLDLAGVPDKWIVEDYVATDAFMRGSFEEQAQVLSRRGIRVPSYALRADKENIVYALACLKTRFGGAENYLLSCGVERSQLEGIRRRFTDESV